MSQREVNSPVTGNLPVPPGSEDCCHVLPHTVDCLSRTFLPPSINLLMSPLLTLGSFFHLEAGQVQSLQVCRMQPNTWFTRLTLAQNVDEQATTFSSELFVEPPSSLSPLPFGLLVQVCRSGGSRSDPTFPEAQLLTKVVSDWDPTGMRGTCAGQGSFGY